MSAFDSLHPALQHHIVNSLGWNTLRPLQEQSINAVLEGRHVIMLAPTAGGKTEACMFPLFSRMLFENWDGLSILYICPLKALLNNLNERLQGYAALIGRTSDVWHGDTPQAKRKKLIASSPHCLLTTPESIEAMLISTRIDHGSFFSNIKVVVVDEIHALAGDDRGWHLLSILERLTRIAGREIQRIGLSATVGNPDHLLSWLAGQAEGKKSILMPGSVTRVSKGDITVDYVGTLDNAALVLSRLYRGEKRLVYCDSRSRVEKLAAELKKWKIRTYVTHSSLSTKERKQSEDAFNHEKDCIIVATSALELGIDIGNLDRVIQIDAPATVSSFLQRLGRSGRREGAVKNCLFLATSELSLLQAAGLVELWQSGYVEPIMPPPEPYHVLVQQILGLLLQEKGIGMNTWRDWIGRIPAFKLIPQETINRILSHMIEAGILAQDQGIIWFGPVGETLYGFKNFMEICSTFISPPLFEVRYGKDVIGYVDGMTFTGNADEQVLLLAGKQWTVKAINRDRKIANVEPATSPGKSIWLGAGPFLTKELCSAIKKLLSNDQMSKTWSKRTERKICELRNEFDWLKIHETAITQNNGKSTWWTFAGKLTNINIANIITHKFGLKTYADNLSVHLGSLLKHHEMDKLRNIDPLQMGDMLAVIFFSHQKTAYKFSECLPQFVLHSMIKERFIFPEQLRNILSQPTIFVRD